MRKKNIITFTDVTNSIPEQYYPTPAKSNIPDWYKKMDSYIEGKKEAYVDDRGFSSATSKKCMPLYDAITSGYIIYLNTDVEVTQTSEGTYYKWPDRDIVSFHDPLQIETHHKNKNLPIPKFHNYWAIRTSPGYSCLFVNPMHRQSVFTCFEGVVDTDKYWSPVHFPFMLNEDKWEGTITAGTPLIQVIPFKRESYQMKVQREEDDPKFVSNLAKINTSIKATFFNGYKDRFWSKKDYS